MSDAISPVSRSGLRPAAGQRRLVKDRAPRSRRMTSGEQFRRAAAGKASGTEASDLGPGAAGGDRSRPGGIALGGRGLPQRLGSASGLSRHAGLQQQAGAPRDATRTMPLLALDQLAAAVAAIPMTVRSSLMPRTSCGAPMAVRMFTVDDGWGWIFTAVEHWNAECVGWHVCKRGDRFRRPAADLHEASRACMDAIAAVRGSGASLADGSRLPVSVVPLHATRCKFWGIQPSKSFVGERADQLASPSGAIAR